MNHWKDALPFWLVSMVELDSQIQTYLGGAGGGEEKEKERGRACSESKQTFWCLLFPRRRENEPLSVHFGCKPKLALGITDPPPNPWVPHPWIQTAIDWKTEKRHLHRRWRVLCVRPMKVAYALNIYSLFLVISLWTIGHNNYLHSIQIVLHIISNLEMNLKYMRRCV